MRQHLIATSFLLATSVPTLAQNVDTLRDGLDHLPASVLVQDHGDVAYFVDVQVLWSLAEADAAASPFMRVMSGADINALESLVRTEKAEWESKAGTTTEALRYFTGYGRPPNSVSFWGLADAAAATDMLAALGALGFEPAGGGAVIGNGEPMRMDPQKRDPSDPWRTRIGAAQFAAIKGSAVVQAQNPQDAMLASAEQPGLGDNAIMQTSLAGLEQSVGEGRIVQAMVISPLFGMTGIDPSVLLSPGDIEETRKKLEEQMVALGSGIPPYLGGILADVQADGPGLAIALAYPDCTLAQQAADLVATRWADMAGADAQGEITAGAEEGEGGLCAATVTVAIGADSAVQNPAYRAVIDAHFRGQAGVLQIGTN